MNRIETVWAHSVRPMAEMLDRTFIGVLQRSPARGGWTYLVTDWSVALFGTRGRVRVRGTVDGVPFESAFLASGDGTHKLAFPVALRRTIRKEAGDAVEVRLLERVDVASRHHRPTTMADVAELASALPEVSEGTRYGNRTWFVGGTGFVWERPLSKADVRRLAGAAVPQGPIVAVTVDDLGEKEAVLAEGRPGVFTIAHFDGHPSVLVQLDVVGRKTIEELVVDGWLAAAPAGLADEFLRRRAEQ